MDITRQTFTPLLYGVGLAIVLTLILRETGPKARRGDSGRFPQPADRLTSTENSHVDDRSSNQKPRPKSGHVRSSKRGLWTKEINVRDFIQRNYTPYYGDETLPRGADRSARWASGRS